MVREGKLMVAAFVFFVVSSGTCLSTILFNRRSQELYFWLVAGLGLVYLVVAINLFRAASRPRAAAHERAGLPGWAALILGPIVGAVTALKFVPGARSMDPKSALVAGGVLGLIGGLAIWAQEAVVARIDRASEEQELPPE